MLHRRLLALLPLTLLLTSACSEDAASGSYDPGEVGGAQAMLRVCADGPTLRGIDVSHWQGTIDWDAVAADGVTFAFIRVSDGDFLDREFTRNWAEAKRVGIRRGVYQFFRAGNDPIADAEILITRMGALEPGDLAPVLDAETMDGQSASTVQANMRRWLEHVAAATGTTPFIYSGSGFWNGSFGSPDFMEYPLWVANYTSLCPSMPSPWTRWVFWQDSSRGSVAGISGNVDMDFFNGDAAALAALGFVGVTCGDGLCDASEDAASCPADCGPVVSCGDGLCDASEDPTSCPADCVSCASIPAVGRTLEESESCFERAGSASAWNEESAGSGGSLLWTPTRDGSADAVGVFRLQFEASGRYRLEVSTPAAYATTTRADYVVHHAGVSETVRIDQSAVDGWQRLGDFLFAAGGEQWLGLGDASGESASLGRAVVHDALRITRVDLPSAPDGGVIDDDAGTGGDASVMPTSGGGCSIGTGGSRRGLGALWVALLALGLSRRRRPR
ncbi:MAG: hypothetical protein GXP55_06210 [Deltaproteobacteria bacterium]|nr:hypothetical protein [Deltaproteobacteria bacterium]